MKDENVPARWRLLGLINGFLINGRDFYGSNAWVMARLGCSEQTVSNAVDELEELGQIICIRTRRSRRIKRNTLDPNQLGSLPKPTRVSDPKQLGTNSVSNSDNLLSESKDSKEEILSEKNSFVPAGATISAMSESGDSIHRKEPEDAFPEAVIKAVFNLFSKDAYLLLSKHKPQREAVKSLLKAKGMGRIQTAMAFYMDHRHMEMCPKVSKPYDLASKWDDLLLFRKRNNL